MWSPDLDVDPGNVDLFPNCDNGQVLKAGGQVTGAGIGAAIAAGTGPLTAGATWAGLAAAGIALADGIDNLKKCKGLP